MVFILELQVTGKDGFYGVLLAIASIFTVLMYKMCSCVVVYHLFLLGCSLKVDKSVFMKKEKGM